MKVKISALAIGAKYFSCGASFGQRATTVESIVEKYSVFVSYRSYFLTLSETQFRISITNLPLEPRVDQQ